MKYYIFLFLVTLITQWIKIYLLYLCWGKKDNRKNISDPLILDFIFQKTGLKLTSIKLVPCHKPFGAMADRYLFWPLMMLSTNLYDTFNKSELEYIVLHEAGHYKLRHLMKLRLILLFWFITGFIILGFVSNKMTLAVTLPLLSLVIGTVINFFVRRIEYQADTYAAMRINDPKAIISATEKMKHAYSNLWQHKLLYPFYSGNTYTNRIKIANEEIEFRKKQVVSL
jgi:hypothetical protein